MTTSACVSFRYFSALPQTKSRAGGLFGLAVFSGVSV